MRDWLFEIWTNEYYQTMRVTGTDPGLVERSQIHQAGVLYYIVWVPRKWSCGTLGYGNIIIGWYVKLHLYYSIYTQNTAMQQDLGDTVIF